MHTYCYRWTHKACRAALKGWYTATLLLPLGTLNSVAFPPLKTEETFTCKCVSVLSRKQTQTAKQAPTFMRMFFVFKENSKWRHTWAS